MLYAEGEDPAAVTRTEKPYTFGKQDGMYEVRLVYRSPPRARSGCSRRATNWSCRSAPSGAISGCPRSMAALLPARARLENRILTVEMKEAQ